MTALLKARAIVRKFSNLIELGYDDSVFINWRKWSIEPADETWTWAIAGYTFELTGSGEYVIEVLSENQIKVYPQDGKHWFIMEK